MPHARLLGPGGLLRALALFWCGACAARAARAPSSDMVGADLLVRAAAGCDLPAAFRVLNSSSFSAAWLTRTGSSGEKPLRAAVRAGCAQIAALIMLQPGFDLSTVQRVRQRKELMQYAMRHAMPGKQVKWALEVVRGVQIAIAAKDDPELRAKRDAWCLPAAGEWFAPASLGEMGITLPVIPMVDEDVLLHGARGGYVEWEGVTARADVVVRLWCMLVGYLQSPVFSTRRSVIARHIRSVGWSLFFGSPSSLARFTFVLDLLARGRTGATAAGKPALEVAGNRSRISGTYRYMGMVLAELWNNTGDFVVV
mmetsp:Transcript_66272/g.185326  ORF Transcript_66272/g.185326 Transcript_66272/m.185326 type:complete len:311 (+) Transcript_66272:67-999(+)